MQLLREFKPNNNCSIFLVLALLAPQTAFLGAEPVFLISQAVSLGFVISENLFFANFFSKVLVVSQIISPLENFLTVDKFDELVATNNL